MERLKRRDQIGRMDVVAHLLAAIAEHGVVLARHRAAHQVREEPVQLRARVIRTCEAAAAEADGGHVEVTPVLLHEQIRGRLGDAEERVGALVDRHRRVDAPVVTVILWKLQPLGQLHQRQLVGHIAVDLVRRAEHERRVRRVLARRLQQVQRPVRVDAEVRLRVGRRPVVRGLRSGVDHELDLACVLGEYPLHAIRVADVDLQRAELPG